MTYEQLTLLEEPRRVPATSRPLKMSNLFYSLIPLVAGTLRDYSVGMMPPDDLTLRISKGWHRRGSITD